MGYAYMYEEDMILGVLSALLTGVPSMLLNIATYVLSSLAIYTIAKRRGLRKPWLAWIPVVNCWLLGSLSDQYRYVVKGENKSKRKVLLVLNILTFAVAMVIVVMIVKIAGMAIFRNYRNESEMMSRIIGPAMTMAGMCLPLVGLIIAYTVVRYMALYDVYKSMDPGNCVLFLVLSVLFGVTEAFFLFFNRNKDEGMPPRREEPVFIPEQPQWQEPAQEPWEAEKKDYL